jgi:4-amino-4-deoxy-L-arabinose transferase-like glycosyltransferase
VKQLPRPTAHSALPHRWEWALLALVLAAAAFLRVYRLDTIPPGLTHDEADTGHFVLGFYRGAPADVEAPYGYANEPFSMVSGALFMHLFGPTYLALRLHSAFFGLLTLLFGYLWARQAFGPFVALGGAALTAISFWCVATSRFALNPQPAPALFAGAVWALWHALFDRRPPQRSWWAWLLGGLLLGGSLWAYEVARATAAALLAFALFLLLTDRPRIRQRGMWLAGALALGLALGAPHLLDPAAWQRSATLATTLRALRAGDPRPLLTTVLEALGTLTFRGDPFITYNIPGQPVFHPSLGLLFYGGLGVCLWRWRRPACALALLWLAAGLAPSMVVGAWNSTLHSMGMQPVLFFLPALAVAEAAHWLGTHYSRRAPALLGAAFAALVVASGVRTFHDYFERWGEARDVRAAYFHNLAAITDYLQRMPDSGSVALSSPFPDLPHDPFIADLRVRRSDLSLSWFDARRAFVFPGAAQGLAIIPSGTPLDPALAARLHLRRLARVSLRPGDVDPYFDVFEWQPHEAGAAFEALPGASASVNSQPVALPVTFGTAVELLAYEISPQRLAAGGELTVPQPVARAGSVCLGSRPGARVWPPRHPVRACAEPQGRDRGAGGSARCARLELAPGGAVRAAAPLRIANRPARRALRGRAGRGRV